MDIVRVEAPMRARLIWHTGYGMRGLRGRIVAAPRRCKWGGAVVSDMARGAISGLVGTTLMSEMLAFAKSSGLLPAEIPQRQIVESLEKKAGIEDKLPEGVKEAAWISQHFAYGTVAGAVYGLVQGRLGMPGAFIPAGVVFGLLLWAIGFGGWAPLAGLYPKPSEDDKHRLGAEVFAHLVYGGVTATLFWMLGRQRTSVY